MEEDRDETLENLQKMDSMNISESDERNKEPEIDEDGFEMVKHRKKK